MIRTTQICIYLFFASITFDQSTENKVIEVYGDGFATELSKTNPQELERLNQYAKVGFIVVEKVQLGDKYPTIKEIPSYNKNEFISIETFLRKMDSNDYNPLMFAWRPSKRRQVYRIDNTDFYVIIPSIHQLNSSK